MKSSWFREFLYSSPDRGDHLRYNLYMCIIGANPKLIGRGGHQSLADCWFKLSWNTRVAFCHRSLFHLKCFDIIFIPVITLFVSLVVQQEQCQCFSSAFPLSLFSWSDVQLGMTKLHPFNKLSVTEKFVFHFIFLHWRKQSQTDYNKNSNDLDLYILMWYHFIIARHLNPGTCI